MRKSKFRVVQISQTSRRSVKGAMTLSQDFQMAISLLDGILSHVSVLPTRTVEPKSPTSIFVFSRHPTKQLGVISKCLTWYYTQRNLHDLSSYHCTDIKNNHKYPSCNQQDRHDTCNPHDSLTLQLLTNTSCGKCQCNVWEH